MFCFFFQAEDGIRDLVRSRGLGDVYKRQRPSYSATDLNQAAHALECPLRVISGHRRADQRCPCLLYTSDAADDLLCVDLGGRRIIKKTR